MGAHRALAQVGSNTLIAASDANIKVVGQTFQL